MKRSVLHLALGAVLACVVMLSGLAAIAASSVPLPAAACTALRAGRAVLPTPMTAAQRGVLLNRAAWAARASGVGLSRKVTGNVCPSLAGSIACDVLRLDGPGTYWDVIIGDAAESINCGASDRTITDPARKWLAPVDPGGSAPPVPPGDPDLAARVRVLESTVATQGRALTALDLRVSLLGNRVQALEAPPAPCVPRDVTTTRDGGGWYGPGHSHRVTVCP